MFAGKLSLLLLQTALSFLPLILGACPPSTDILRRVGETRFYIVHRNTRGDFVSFNESFATCEKYGLQVPKIPNMRTMVVVGRELEKLVNKHELQDTWYWLDAKYNSAKDVYEWGSKKPSGVVQYSNFYYRPPRPLGVGSFMSHKNQYQPTSPVEQCLTLALPLPGTKAQKQKGEVYGHQTMFDERPCEGVKARHAICESLDKSCHLTKDDPFVLTEDKTAYFEEGNWIFGDRRYMINWKPRTFNESVAYCKSFQLELFTPELKLDMYLVPHIKMWSREVTTSQFWTKLSYNSIDNAMLDEMKKQVAQGDRIKILWNQTPLEGRSNKLDTEYCVALMVAYEFKGQLPCKDHGNPRCQWSFLEYQPANCNNYLGTICQHKDYKERGIAKIAGVESNVQRVLNTTAITERYGDFLSTKAVRSKYKQTFGSLLCPRGYRMMRASNHKKLAKLQDVYNDDYVYDYLETFWVVDEDLFDKDANSLCTISVPIDLETPERKLKKVKCTEWHFYACEPFSEQRRRCTASVPKTPKMEWREGPQPRTYPLTINDNGGGRAGGKGYFSGDYKPASPEDTSIRL